MVDSKPTTRWAIASLICGILGCLAALALLAMLNQYSDLANRSAGVGSIFLFAHGLMAVALGLLGIVLGAIALVRIGTGEYRGRGQAWTGIVLGCLPLAFPMWLVLNSDSNPLRGSRPACVVDAARVD